jgi:hypothetical protein
MKQKQGPLHFYIEGEIEPMSQITATVSFDVNPATTGGTLLFTPNTELTADTEGVLDSGQILGEVTGGTAPYTFTATGVPLGMTLAQEPDADGVGVDVVISGTPTVGDAAQSPYSIVLTITDNAGATTQTTLKPAPKTFTRNKR